MVQRILVYYAPKLKVEQERKKDFRKKVANGFNKLNKILYL